MIILIVSSEGATQSTNHRYCLCKRRTQLFRKILIAGFVPPFFTLCSVFIEQFNRTLPHFYDFKTAPSSPWSSSLYLRPTVTITGIREAQLINFHKAILPVKLHIDIKHQIHTHHPTVQAARYFCKEINQAASTQNKLQVTAHHICTTLIGTAELMEFGSSTTWGALLNGNDGYQSCFHSQGTYQLPLSCSLPKCSAPLLSHLHAGSRRVVIVQSSTLSSQSYLLLLRRLPGNKGKHRQGRNLSPFCKSAKRASLELFILCEMAQPQLLITGVLYLQDALCNSEHPFKGG